MDTRESIKLILYFIAKIPSGLLCQRGLLLDIQIYLDVLEMVHSAAGGEGAEVLFCILNRYGERSELTVIP